MQFRSACCIPSLPTAPPRPTPLSFCVVVVLIEPASLWLVYEGEVDYLVQFAPFSELSAMQWRSPYQFSDVFCSLCYVADVNFLSTGFRMAV